MNKPPSREQVARALRAVDSNADPHVKPPQNRALPLTYFDELSEPPAKQWLIKGVIARGETSSWIGPPGGAKSSILTDIAVHVAGGRNWRGYKTKSASGVVYFALERAGLTKRRFAAYRRRDDLGNLPIAVAGELIDFMNPGCVNIILSTIEKAEQHFGCDAGLAIVDTYNKGIAAGGGDEDKARDQNIAHANIRRILERKNIHIAGIGHTGKDESRGERGSNARRADVDLLVQITGDGIKTAEIKKANDQPDGTLTGFTLEPYEFGVDDDGDPVRTFIVSEHVLAGAASGRQLTDHQKLGLAALTEALLSHGQDAPAEYGLPKGIKVVIAERWKTELLRRNVIDPSGTNPRARFGELRKNLAARNFIGVRDDFVWAVRPD